MVVRRQDNLVFVLKIQLGIIKSSSNSKNYFLINKWIEVEYCALLGKDLVLTQGRYLVMVKRELCYPNAWQGCFLTFYWYAHACADSSGLSWVGTCFQHSVPVNSWIWETRFMTNVFHRVDAALIHAKTMVESVKRWMLWIGIPRKWTVFLTNLASRTAPQSSNLGRVTLLTGATRDLEHSNLLDMWCCW